MNAIFRRVVAAAITIAVVSFLFMFVAGPYAATIFVKPGDKELLDLSIVAVELFSFAYLFGWIDLSVPVRPCRHRQPRSSRSRATGSRRSLPPRQLGRKAQSNH